MDEDLLAGLDELEELEDLDDLDEDIQKALMEEEFKEKEPSTEAVNKVPQDEQCESYKVVLNTKLEEGEEPLSRVIGHDNQKKEILNVIKWFKQSSELKARGVSIPKGVILFGNPGNGKSLMIKEIIRCVEAPVFVFQGEQTNIVQGIVDVFNKAREAGHSIIVIDELDLLIGKDRRVIRALQENLDGVESDDDILVLTATNYINDIPDPLTRNGRLEKLIHIPYPTGKEALQLLKKHFKEFNIALPKDIDEEELALSLNNISCASIKAVVNDIVLRNGFENITTEMIDDSIYNITNRVKSAPEEDNLEVAIHEAAHAVVARSFPEYFVVNRLNISGASGVFHAKEVEQDFWPYKKIIADIKICMAGNLAQKIILNGGSRGAESDLQRARIAAYNMITQNGYFSCWETLPAVQPGSRIETQTKRRRVEKKIEKLLRRCEKETRRYIKAHSREIIDLGHLLFEKKNLKSSEILSVIG